MKTKIKSPLKVWISKAKMFILNLNQYRNMHFRALNIAKSNYKKAVTTQVLDLKPFKKAICVYRVYFNSKRRFDLGNVCCVHEKFFEDALVELGKLPDDNTEYIPIVVYMKGKLRKEDPCVEIELLEYNRKGIDKLVEMIYNMYREEEEN